MAGFDDQRLSLLRGNAEKLRCLSLKRGFDAGMRARGERSVDGLNHSYVTTVAEQCPAINELRYCLRRVSVLERNIRFFRDAGLVRFTPSE